MLSAIDPAQASLERLQTEGIVWVQYPELNSDQADAMLHDLVQRWGQPHLHDQQGRLVWDVRTQPGSPARSHGLDEFRLHSDASFEDPPPRYIALFVVTADSQGGGESLWISVDEVLQRISVASREALQQEFCLRVPQEFSKQADAVGRGPLHCPPSHMRYRSELLIPPTCPRQIMAIQELDAALQGPVHRRWLPAGSLLLLDNWRFLHGRTPIRDPRRHLKRVRFFGPNRPPAFGVERYLPGFPLPRGAYLVSPEQARPGPGQLPPDPWLGGIDLFNHGYYWEAHEAWEHLWQQSAKDSPEGWVLRGLIQAAAACLKGRQHNRRGLESLRQRALQTLRSSGLQSWRGLTLQGLKQQLALPSDLPRIYLQLNRKYSAGECDPES